VSKCAIIPSVSGNLSHIKQKIMNEKTPFNPEDQKWFAEGEKAEVNLSEESETKSETKSEAEPEDHPFDTELTNEEKDWFDKGANA